MPEPRSRETLGIAGSECTPTDEADVVLVGEGLTAVTCALSMAALSGAPPRGKLAWFTGQSVSGSAVRSGRAIVLAAASMARLNALGVTFGDGQATPIREILVSDRGHAGRTVLSADDSGVEALGWVVPEAVLGEQLWRRLESLSEYRPIGSAVTGLVTSGGYLRYHQNGDSGWCRLMVGADGSASPVAAEAGIVSRHRQYRQVALTAELVTSLAHRNRAYERFTASGPIALLPSSEPQGWHLIWTLPECEAVRIAGNPEALLARAQALFGHRVGRWEQLRVTGQWPLFRVARRPIARGRVVLLGNAANTLHPVAGQGFNLALRDIAVLCQWLQRAFDQGMDPGSTALLDRYVRSRRRDQEGLLRFTDTLPRLFQSRLPWVAGARNLGLLGMELIPELKFHFARRAMGWGPDRVDELAPPAALAGE